MVHSGASGRVASHSETRVVLRRWVRKGVSGWHIQKEAFGLAFGTSVILRRFPNGCFNGASKGSSGRALRRLRKGFGTRGALRRASKGGAPMWHVPKVVVERVSVREVAGWLSRGSSGRVWIR